jgi:hypothetical protein
MVATDRDDALSEASALRAEVDRLRDLIMVAAYAWTVEGVAPEFHRAAVREVRHKWATLARALDALTREAR